MSDYNLHVRKRVAATAAAALKLNMLRKSRTQKLLRAVAAAATERAGQTKPYPSGEGSAFTSTPPRISLYQHLKNSQIMI